MRKSFVFTLSVLLLAFAFSTVFAETAEIKRYQTKLTNKNLTGGEYYDLSGAVGGSYLGSSRVGPLQMGETIYDYQHNGSMGRQVTYDPAGNIVHFYWMWDNLAGQGRNMKYNAYLPGGTWQHGSGPSGGLAVSGDNGGYGGIDLASGGRALGYHHQGLNPDVYKSHAGIDILPPTGAFTFYGAPSPGADGAGALNCEGWETGAYELASGYIWPMAEFDIVGSDQIVHMVAAESPPTGAPAGEIQTLVYYRGVANATTAAIAWPSCGMAIDSVYNIAVLVREDPLSDEVAISWIKPIYYDGDPADPCGFTQWQNDIMVWKSADGGVTWDRNDIENVTDYLGNNGTIEDVSMAYTDHAMLYDTEGHLHIVWSTPLNPIDDGDPCAKQFATKMWHWSDAPGGCISLVYDASKPSLFFDTGAWNMSTAKMNISECDDKFYVSFTRFGAYTSANGDTSVDASEAGYENGEIFLTGSSDGGETWGEAVNVTNTQSAGCASGDCFSEHWSSMAKYSTGEVHIQYIEDKDAGGFPQTEGGITENPVQYISHPCFTPSEFCAVSITPLSIGYPTHIAPQGGSGCTSGETTTFNLTLQNAGNQSTAYSVTPSDGWITRSGGDPLSGTINAGCDATKTIEIQLGPIAVEGVYNGSLDIVACGESFEVPIELYVFCEFFTPENELLNTACWSVGVWNTARVGLAQQSDLGNMYWFLEEVSLMYDEGVVISYDDTTNTYFSLFDGSENNVDFVALSPLTVTANPTYEYATGEFATPDTNICGIIEYYAPVHPDTCVLIEHVTITNCDDVAHTVSIGEGVDFDIPDGEEGSDNRAGDDPTRQMLYMYGPGLGGPEDDYYGGVGFDPSLITIPGGQILNNDTWVYDNSGYDPAEIGGLLNRISGFSSAIDSIFDQNMFFAIYQEEVLQPGESLEYCKVKTSSLTGLANLEALIDKGFQWAQDNNACGEAEPPACFIGDVNGSGAVDIDDIVYEIAYVFQGGPAPVPEECCGDANGSGAIDIDDIVYLIAYVFQGGPEPDQTACD